MSVYFASVALSKGHVGIFYWMLYPLKSIQVKDCVKVASSKVVNPYHEFAVSFGKSVGIG